MTSSERMMSAKKDPLNEVEEALKRLPKIEVDWKRLKEELCEAFD